MGGTAKQTRGHTASEGIVTLLYRESSTWPSIDDDYCYIPDPEVSFSSTTSCLERQKTTTQRLFTSTVTDVIETNRASVTAVVEVGRLESVWSCIWFVFVKTNIRKHFHFNVFCFQYFRFRLHCRSSPCVKNNTLCYDLISCITNTQTQIHANPIHVLWSDWFLWFQIQTHVDLPPV